MKGTCFWKLPKLPETYQFPRTEIERKNGDHLLTFRSVKCGWGKGSKTVPSIGKEERGGTERDGFKGGAIRSLERDDGKSHGEPAREKQGRRVLAAGNHMERNLQQGTPEKKAQQFCPSRKIRT